MDSTSTDQVHSAGILHDLAVHDLLVHEMRSPLTVVVGRLQLIRMRERQGAIDPEWLDVQLNAIELATNILVELVDWVPQITARDHAD